MIVTKWPYTTPSGHIYEHPENFDELWQRAMDMAQAHIEGWEDLEHPPEPTWEMIGIAMNEAFRLRRAIQEHRDEHLHLDSAKDINYVDRELRRGEADMRLWEVLP